MKVSTVFRVFVTVIALILFAFSILYIPPEFLSNDIFAATLFLSLFMLLLIVVLLIWTSPALD
ncbi:hypothetical protein [Alphaspiravirus yamagawaense]|uniref:Uncharacterized protein n=1 Tax=Alphaspiravirus yamagawaense TaxID=1157339 RepID=J7Q209_9VIRU|nr:hypothetical protein [Aeropyrum coil-shaped virus]CCG27845.1 hypothetical protein [Aeropyrum coil-shaped virus]